MKIQFIYGPNVGVQDDMADAVGAGFIKAGLAIEIVPQPLSSADEEANQSRQGLPTTKAGWSVVRHIGDQGQVSYVICETLATGEKTYYKGIPPKRRVTRYDQERDVDIVEWVESSCPKELVSQWETLSRQSGTNVDHDYVGWLKDQAKNKLQLEIDDQKHLTGKLY